MNKNEVIALLLALVVAMGLTLATMMRGCTGNGPKADPGNTPTSTPTPTPEPLPAVGPVRLKQTYEPGKIYRVKMDYLLKAPGHHKRWGLRTEMEVMLLGVFEYDMEILENNGDQVLLELTVQKSFFTEMAFEADVVLELDASSEILLETVIQVAAEYLSEKVKIPSGTVRVSQEKINALLKKTDLDSELVKKLVKPERLAGYIESLEGIRVRMRYLDGKGLLDFEVLGHPSGEAISFDQLSEEEQMFFRKFHPFPDPFIFPDEKVEQGEIWTVRGEHLPVRLPMRVNSHRPEGSVTLSRQPNQNGIVPLNVEGGKLFLKAETAKGHHISADWTPRGDFHYDTKTGIISNAKLKGSMEYASGGKDFWVFEVTQSARPTYEVRYTCKVFSAEDGQD